MVNVAVLGAGIIGLTSAVKIKEKYKNFKVVLISHEFTPNTTGDGSGGLWYPYFCGKTPEHLLTKWGGETYKFLHELWLEGGYDISVMPIYELYRDLKEEYRRPAWAKIVFGYREIDRKHLEYLSDLYSAKYTSGYTFTTFVASPPTLLKYLHKRFQNAGGIVQVGGVSSLTDPKLRQYQIIVNCTGISSRNIVPDGKVFPIRGQIAKVSASWINMTVIDTDSDNYIIPNAEICVLGGTHQEHDYNTQVYDKDAEFILNGCKQLVPGLKYAKIVNHWVGLRPGRDEIRLDSEEIDGKFYIHCYGHGGSGITLAWGCASEVLDILQNYLNKNKLHERSKL